MINRYHKWKDRRHASAVKPLAFLLAEFGLMALVSWMVFIVAPLWLSVLVIVGLLYFFLTNSLKRYLIVRDRQQYYKSESTETNKSEE